MSFLMEGRFFFAARLLPFPMFLLVGILVRLGLTARGALTAPSSALAAPSATPFTTLRALCPFFFKGLEEKLLVFYERFFLALFCDFLLLC